MNSKTMVLKNPGELVYPALKMMVPYRCTVKTYIGLVILYKDDIIRLLPGYGGVVTARCFDVEINRSECYEIKKETIYQLFDDGILIEC